MDIKVDKYTFGDKNHYQVFIDGVKFPNVSNYVKLRSKKFYIPADMMDYTLTGTLSEEEEKSLVIKRAKINYDVMKEFGWFE